MDSLLDNNVFAIAADEDGQKWIGTWYGITLLDNTNNWVKNIRFTDGLYNNFVRDIKVDTNNNIWVGMFADYNLDGGISGFDGTNWYSYSLAQGLVDMQVIRIAIDKSNDVWIATGNGISMLHANELGIINTPSEQSFSVFPNPTSEIINIDAPGINLKNISLFNAVGQKVLNTNRRSLDVSKIHDGIYFLNIQTDTERCIKKIIINHN